MSETKVFGMKLGIDPKIIVVALLLLAAIIYYLTSGSTEGSTSTGANGGAIAVDRPALNSSAAARAEALRRNRTSLADRGTLKLVPVDGSRGDIDPTLKLSLLERVRNIQSTGDQRNLFESAAVQNLPALPTNAPKIIPKPTPPVVPVTASTPQAPAFMIPLKYYGFVKPIARSLDGNRGFFMDGDNILIGGEGDMLEKRFLIVALTPNNARLEDTEAKQGQDLPVTPEAPPAQ